MKLKLAPVRTLSDLRPEYQQTPIADLFRYHGEGAPGRSYARPPLVLLTCMDWRITVRVPESFAYVLRTAGANVESVLFNIDYAVAVLGVEAIALVGHDDCAMTAVHEHRRAFESGLVREQGWSAEKAAQAFESGASWFGLESAMAGVWSSAEALRKRYPKRLVAPLYYQVKEGRLVQVVAET